MNIFLTVIVILLAVILIVSGACFFTKLRIKIAVTKLPGKKTDTSVILETAGGLFKKNLLKSDSAKNKKQKSKKPPNQNQQTDSGIRQKFNTYYQTFCKIKYIFSLSRHRVRKNILVEKLKINIDFGLDDAAHTGIATGTVWAAVYNAVAFASQLAKLNEPEISVNPDFENEKLACNGECIIVLRLANIISILFVLGINYLNFKNKEKAAINYGNTD